MPLVVFVSVGQLQLCEADAVPAWQVGATDQLVDGVLQLHLTGYYQ